MVACMLDFLVPLEVILNSITSIHGVFLQGVSLRHYIHHQGQRKLNFVGYYLFLVFFHHKCNTHWDFFFFFERKPQKGLLIIELVNPFGWSCRFTCKELNITTKDFNSKEMLGHGGFGNVYNNTWCDTSAFVVMKKIAHDSYQCGHESIVKVFVIS